MRAVVGSVAISDLTIGFTGTQLGMTSWQIDRVDEWLTDCAAWCKRTGKRPVFRHGDCIGADLQAAGTARLRGFYVIAHPCTIESKRGWSLDNHQVRIPKAPLDRNHDIVNASDYLLATPKEDFEVLRSGTWATIRFARKIGLFVHVVYP